MRVNLFKTELGLCRIKFYYQPGVPLFLAHCCLIYMQLLSLLWSTVVAHCSCRKLLLHIVVLEQCTEQLALKVKSLDVIAHSKLHKEQFTDPQRLIHRYTKNICVDKSVQEEWRKHYNIKLIFCVFVFIVFCCFLFVSSSIPLFVFLS